MKRGCISKVVTVLAASVATSSSRPSRSGILEGQGEIEGLRVRGQTGRYRGAR